MRVHSRRVGLANGPYLSLSRSRTVTKRAPAICRSPLVLAWPEARSVAAGRTTSAAARRAVAFAARTGGFFAARRGSRTVAIIGRAAENGLAREVDAAL